MAYRASQAALAYDMTSDLRAAERQSAPVPERPHLDVVTGAGREADQSVSPMFAHCVKVVCVLAVIVVALGFARVAVAGLTASTLNSAAQLSNQLEASREESSELEVMHSVYGSSTRIRDLAEGYGMVPAEESVTLDFTEYAPADSAAAQGASTR